MKKIMFALAAMGLLIITSCSKSGSASFGNAGGTWTFKSITYQADSCDSAQVSLLAMVPGEGTPSGGGELAVDFYNNLPTYPVTLTIINGIILPANATQAAVGITDLNGNNYASTGYGQETISVTVSNGKLSISGSGIELVNIKNPSDSGSLSFTIHRTD